MLQNALVMYVYTLIDSASQQFLTLRDPTLSRDVEVSSVMSRNVAGPDNVTLRHMEVWRDTLTSHDPCRHQSRDHVTDSGIPLNSADDDVARATVTWRDAHLNFALVKMHSALIGRNTRGFNKGVRVIRIIDKFEQTSKDWGLFAEPWYEKLRRSSGRSVTENVCCGFIGGTSLSGHASKMCVCVTVLLGRNTLRGSPVLSFWVLTAAGIGLWIDGPPHQRCMQRILGGLVTYIYIRPRSDC